ncbi:MAG: undecaprenyl/decaprenyl-phosphate alpha-N-acetylglucosaminyl 1-phosphate transferase [Elusimicrobia bacterium]|nr:undecaprenyl/decaprenyl-phosphate alpha-N-acetylglucosaminyl 1-phosphate transferase [Candidatus Obscuribacterium magneticum]
MKNPNVVLYIITFSMAFSISLVLTVAARAAAIVLNIYDHPSSALKTHREPVPYLGGVAIFLAFAFSLVGVRILTSFPTGTLRSLRGILLGSFLMFALGLVDDIIHHGLHYRTKFMVQIISAAMVIGFGIHIHFIQPSWLAIALSLLWIVGLTNAFNLIDIMDGLASGVATIAALSFLFISLPTEAIYVNFAAAALAGAALGFMPYNLSKNLKIFMGDSGSLFVGFVAASLSLGTSYSEKTQIGVLAPLLILAVPIFDTLLVFYLRVRRGTSPFLGSKDHFPLRLEALGWPRRNILILTLCLSALFCLGAFAITRVQLLSSLVIYLFFIILMGLFTTYLLRAKVQ